MNKVKIIALFAIFTISLAFSLFTGAVDINVKELFSPPTSTILWNVRAPRVIAAIFIGATLGVCGCVMQAILQNPLVSPYTLGVCGGAAFGAALATILGASSALPLFAFFGATLSLCLTLSIAATARFKPHALLLSGMMMNIFFSSLVILLFSFTESKDVHKAVLWLSGDLSGANPSVFFLIAQGVNIGVFFLFSKTLDVLSLGDEKARSLGVEPNFCRWWMLLLSAFATSLCVCEAGIIGFVGLMIPALFRHFFSCLHTSLIPCVSIGGAIFLLLADTFSRTVFSPYELPVGVATGVCGAAFFFLLFCMKGNA